MNFNIIFFLGGGGVQENKYFLGYENFWIFLGGHLKIGLVLVFFLCTLASFLKVNIQNRDFFGLQKFPIIFVFLGVGVNSRC